MPDRRRGPPAGDVPSTRNAATGAAIQSAAITKRAECSILLAAARGGRPAGE